MFRQDFSCPALLEDLGPAFRYGAVTRSGPPFQTVRVAKTQAAGLVRVRSPLLTESRLMSFPPATEMFQFAGFASHAYEFSMGSPFRGGVAPFGDPGITDRSHLPRAFRSVLRPSSPLSAKASTRCPSLHSLAPRTAANPTMRGSSMKTPLGTRHRAHAPRPVPRSRHNSLLHPSINPAGRHPRRQSLCIFSELARAPFAAAIGGSGGDRVRTDALLLAKQALSQLSYTPMAATRGQEPGARKPRFPTLAPGA
jgi:hypothetical protein